MGVSEKLIVKEDPSLYHHINQGCLKVDGMDEKEEMIQVDVGSMYIHQGIKTSLCIEFIERMYIHY